MVPSKIRFYLYENVKNKWRILWTAPKRGLFEQQTDTSSKTFSWIIAFLSITSRFLTVIFSSFWLETQVLGLWPPKQNTFAEKIDESRPTNGSLQNKTADRHEATLVGIKKDPTYSKSGRSLSRGGVLCHTTSNSAVKAFKLVMPF